MTRSAQQRVSCFSIAAALVLMAVLVGPARGAASATGSPPRDDAARPELQRLLDQTVAAGAPGVVALVNDGQSGRVGDGDEGWDRDGHERRHGDGVWTGASGVADLRTRRPMRPGDRFRVATVTVPFVATVVLQLVGEGRLSLSDSGRALAAGDLAVRRSDHGAPTAQPHQRRARLHPRAARRALARRPVPVLAPAGAGRADRRPAAGFCRGDRLVALQHRLRAGRPDRRAGDGSPSDSGGV